MRGWFLVMVPPQLILRPARFFLVLFSGQRSHCEVWRRCPVQCPCPQQAFLTQKMCSLGDFPPRSPGPGPSQADRTSSCDGRLGSRSPSFGLPCGVLPRLRSRFRAGASTSSLRFARVRALSCLPSRAPTPRTWQRRLSQPRQWVRSQRFPRPGLVQRPRPSTPEGSTFLASVFTATPASPKGSISPRNAGELPTGGTPPTSCGFSVAAASPSGFSCALGDKWRQVES